MSRFRSHGDPLTGPSPDSSTAAVLRRQLPESIPDPPDLQIVPGELERLAVREADEWSSSYKARTLAPEPNEVVEIKTYRLPSNGEAISRMADRARAWAGISDHPYVLPVIDWDTDPVPWIGLDCLSGGTLRRRIDRLTGSEMLWIALSVLRTLSSAHVRGVFHLALTPESIRFRESVTNAWDVPQVSDWDRAGLRTLDEEGPVPDARYAAPEEFDPETYGRPDQSTDIFRAGAVFYHLFTGQPPFRDPHERPPDGGVEPMAPSSIDLTLPPQFDRVILRALHPDKGLRYETIDDFRGSFEDFIEWYADATVLEALRSPVSAASATSSGAMLSARESAVLRLVESMGGTTTPRELADRVGNAAETATTVRRFRNLQYRPEAKEVLDSLVKAGFLTRYQAGTLYYAVPGNRRGPTPQGEAADPTRADGGSEG